MKARILFAALLFAAAAPVAAAETTKIVVPFSPGGANDVVARIVAEKLTANGRQTIVVNRPGGSATIGTAEVAKAKPDGTTLGVASVSFSVNPFLIPSLPYDTEKDFVPVTVIATVPFVLTVHPDVKARSVAELVAMLKSDPEKYGFSSAGHGSGTHLSTELFMSVTGTRMMHVPYKGGAEQVTASLNGNVGVMFTSLPTSLGFVKSGALIPLAITSDRRDARLPDVPTFGEAGVSDYRMNEWTALVAPKGTPPEVVQKLSAEIRTALEDPEVRRRIEAVGGTIVGSAPEQAAAHIGGEIAKWKRLVAEKGIKPQ